MATGLRSIGRLLIFLASLCLSSPTLFVFLVGTSDRPLKRFAEPATAPSSWTIFTEIPVRRMLSSIFPFHPLLVSLECFYALGDPIAPPPVSPRPLPPILVGIFFPSPLEP